MKTKIVQSSKKSLPPHANIPVIEIYNCNPVLEPGPAGTWDAGALGSMSVLRVGGVFHMYYEAWGIRGTNSWEVSDYDSLQIGHATSPDGYHWSKDPANPVLPKGTSGDWDEKGTWDPFVLYEDGLFKMWYGGGNQICDWGYAESKGGVHFVKKQRLSHLGSVEDDHIVHDKRSGTYFMYYWDRKYEPFGLCRARSIDEIRFDFAHPEPIRIKGLKYPKMYKFTHVIIEQGIWYMVLGEFERPGCKDCYSWLATSKDGLAWTARKKPLLSGQDLETVKAGNDMWLMYYGPDGYFDQAHCDIRLAIYHGNINELASGQPISLTAPLSQI